MRRRAATVLLAFAAVLGGVSAHAAGPAPAGAASWPATVRVSQCSLLTHSAVFHARMKPVKGAVRMAMRVRLQERPPGGRYVAVEAPGLGKWRRSKPGVGAFGFRQRVRNMEDGYSYRARVDYRWIDADGDTRVRTRRRSRACRQAQPLPNLRITGLRLGARGDLPKGVARYLVTVANTGRGPASGVPVRLGVDGNTVDTSIVFRLEPGESREVAFTGPACERPGSPVRAVADPDRAVPETRERDNVLKARCDSIRP